MKYKSEHILCDIVYYSMLYVFYVMNGHKIVKANVCLSFFCYSKGITRRRNELFTLHWTLMADDLNGRRPNRPRPTRPMAINFTFEHKLSRSRTLRSLGWMFEPRPKWPTRPSSGINTLGRTSVS